MHQGKMFYLFLNSSFKENTPAITTEMRCKWEGLPKFSNLRKSAHLALFKFGHVKTVKPGL